MKKELSKELQAIVKALHSQQARMDLALKKCENRMKGAMEDVYELQELIHEAIAIKGKIEGIGRAIHTIKREGVK